MIDLTIVFDTSNAVVVDFDIENVVVNLNKINVAAVVVFVDIFDFDWTIEKNCNFEI